MKKIMLKMRDDEEGITSGRGDEEIQKKKYEIYAKN